MRLWCELAVIARLKGALQNENGAFRGVNTIEQA